jgi:hypothetical protein
MAETRGGEALLSGSADFVWPHSAVANGSKQMAL